MKCFVHFRLKPGVTPAQYEEWFRASNVPVVSRLSSISSYRVWRVTGAMEGEPAFEFLEEMELDDREAFEREIESVPEMAAMLEGWYEQVADQVILYAEEVAQS